jgi:hypothetical protein
MSSSVGSILQNSSTGFWSSTINLAIPYASNLFNAVRYGQPIDGKLDAIRSHLASDTIQEFTMLVAATDLQGMIQLLNDRFMTERALCPLDNSYNNRAQYIQLGQLKKPTDRPSYKLCRVLSYRSFQEYYTPQGYGTVQEYEFNSATDGSDEDVGADDSKDEDIGADDSEDGGVGVDEDVRQLSFGF